MDEKYIVELLSKTLAHIFKRIQWKQFTYMKKSKIDSFAERLRVASGQQNVPQMMEKVCKGYGLSGAEMYPDDIEQLDEDRETVRKLLGKESVYIALKTQKECDEFFRQLKLKKGNKSFDEF